jgi:hypothetical protein
MPIKINFSQIFEPKVSKVPITQQGAKWAPPSKIKPHNISKNESNLKMTMSNLPTRHLSNYRLPKATLNHILRISRNLFRISPQPTHHVWKNRPSKPLTMIIHAPGVSHVIPLSNKSVLHPNVLQKPVPLLVVNPVPNPTVIIPTIAKVNPNRLLLALQNHVGILMPTPNVGKTAHIRKHFSELIWPLPSHRESRNRARTRTTNPPLFRVIRKVVILLQRRQKLLRNHPGVLVIERVVFHPSVSKSIAPTTLR